MNDLERSIYLRLIGWKDGDKTLTDEQITDAYNALVLIKQTAKIALLKKLDITADEATLLLG
jgi:hypothetical protein